MTKERIEEIRAALEKESWKYKQILINCDELKELLNIADERDKLLETLQTQYGWWWA